jgi:hypothetical protein
VCFHGETKVPAKHADTDNAPAQFLSTRQSGSITPLRPFIGDGGDPERVTSRDAATDQAAHQDLYLRFMRSGGLFKQRFHFSLILGLPLVKWKEAIDQAPAAKALINAIEAA